MPKREKQPKPKVERRLRDVNQRAYHLVQKSTEEPAPVQPEPETVTAVELSKVMSILGKRGGKIGGKRRLETMTPEQRSQVALKAARARWAKKKHVGKG